MSNKPTNSTDNTNSADKRDTMLKDAISPKPPKPAVFNAVPVTSSTYLEGKLMPSFVLKLKCGDIAPSIGDKVCFKFGVTTFNGTVYSTDKQGVITLQLT